MIDNKLIVWKNKKWKCQKCWDYLESIGKICAFHETYTPHYLLKEISNLNQTLLSLAIYFSISFVSLIVIFFAFRLLPHVLNTKLSFWMLIMVCVGQFMTIITAVFFYTEMMEIMDYYKILKQEYEKRLKSWEVINNGSK